MARKRKVLKISPNVILPKKSGVRQVKPVIYESNNVHAKTKRYTPVNHFNYVPVKPLITHSHSNLEKGKFALVKNKKILLVLHLFYKDLALSYLKKLKSLKGNLKFDICVNIVQGSSADTPIINKRYHKELNAHCTRVPNVSKDILSKLKTLYDLVRQKKKYDYVFLFHDKKSAYYESRGKNKWMDKWMEDLTSLLFDPAKRSQCLLSFETDPSIGLIGDSKHLHYGPGWSASIYRKKRYHNENELIGYQEDLFKYLNITSDRYYPKQTWFIGGTMFWMRWDVIEHFMTRYPVPRLFTPLAKERGDIRDPSYTHCMERFFGHIVGLNGKKVMGL